MYIILIFRRRNFSRKMSTSPRAKLLQVARPQVRIATFYYYCDGTLGFFFLFVSYHCYGFFTPAYVKRREISSRRPKNIGITKTTHTNRFVYNNDNATATLLLLLRLHVYTIVAELFFFFFPFSTGQ